MFDDVTMLITIMLQVIVVMMSPAMLVITMTFDDITK